ncbi:MAG: DinB family protein [Fimbriimonadales bacterium]
MYNPRVDVTEALLDSWDRQCRIVEAVASRVDESNRHVKPSEDGWPLDYQLAHIHNTRRFWLSHVAPEHGAALERATEDDKPLPDLNAIKAHLEQSGKAVREAVSELLEKGVEKVSSPNVTYDHPVMFLQHMVWHEGWHVGLIFLGLRLAGQEPPEEWEDEKVWGEWRTEVW